jgi:hypothetical protein
MAAGSACMIRSAVTCPWPLGSVANPAPQSSTGNRSRPREKGIRGYDAGKQVNGSKRHILVDTLGLILAVVVTAANVQDRDGVKSLLAVLGHKFSRVRQIWADGAYAGPLVGWVKPCGRNGQSS